MRRPVLLAFAVGLFAALGLSCLGPLPVEEYTYACASDGDCTGNHLCIRGVCKVPSDCSTADDCGTGHCCDTFAFTYTCVRAGQACSFGACNAATRTCE